MNSGKLCFSKNNCLFSVLLFCHFSLFYFIFLLSSTFLGTHVLTVRTGSHASGNGGIILSALFYVMDNLVCQPDTEWLVHIYLPEKTL